MKAKIYDWYTEIFPSQNEVDSICKIGHGADTCVWLILGPNGFECCSKSRPLELIDRWHNGLTVAKRDGCPTVNEFNPSNCEMGPEIELEVKI